MGSQLYRTPRCVGDTARGRLEESARCEQDGPQTHRARFVTSSVDRPVIIQVTSRCLLRPGRDRCQDQPVNPEIRDTLRAAEILRLLVNAAHQLTCHADRSSRLGTEHWRDETTLIIVPTVPHSFARTHVYSSSTAVSVTGSKHGPVAQVSRHPLSLARFLSSRTHLSTYMR